MRFSLYIYQSGFIALFNFSLLLFIFSHKPHCFKNSIPSFNYPSKSNLLSAQNSSGAPSDYFILFLLSNTLDFQPRDGGRVKGKIVENSTVSVVYMRLFYFGSFTWESFFPLVYIQNLLQASLLPSSDRWHNMQNIHR